MRSEDGFPSVQRGLSESGEWPVALRISVECGLLACFL